MTATVPTAVALTKACFAAAALLAGLAASSAQAAVAQPGANANQGTVVASYSYPSDRGHADSVGSHGQVVSHSAQVAGQASSSLRLAADPSLLWVAALGALCLSLSSRRPAARHADRLRQRLGSDEVAQG